MLVGRRAELAALRGRLLQARRGQGVAVLVLGDPGVGKTSLIANVLWKARGVTVLTAAGVESERNLGFAALSDLVRPVLEFLEVIPEAQASAAQRTGD